MIYLFCYDITKPSRLSRVARTLEKYGIRVQQSFFQCDLKPEYMEKLKREVLVEIDTKSDKFYIYPICNKCLNGALKDGTGEVPKVEEFIII